MSKKEKLLKAIEEMLEGNVDTTIAICENLSKKTETFSLGYDVVEKFSPSWKYYSGCEFFPVSGEEVWYDNYRKDSHWMGEQRELRISLLEHMKSEILKLTDEEVEEMFEQ